MKEPRGLDVYKQNLINVNFFDTKMPMREQPVRKSSQTLRRISLL